MAANSPPTDGSSTLTLSPGWSSQRVATPPATSTRKFNEQAGKLANTVVLVVSSDLPFAAKRFCTTEGLQNVVPLSLMRSRDFAKDYGVLMTDGGLAGICARAVVVLDESDKVIHSQLVPEIKQEPDYDSALAVLKK